MGEELWSMVLVGETDGDSERGIGVLSLLLLPLYVPLPSLLFSECSSSSFPSVICIGGTITSV